jgi:hypothetical protein
VRFDRYLYSKYICIQISIIIIWERFDRHSYLMDIHVWLSICCHLSEIRQTFVFEGYSCLNIYYYNLNEIRQTFVLEGYSCLNIHLLLFEWDSTDIRIRKIFKRKYPYFIIWVRFNRHLYSEDIRIQLSIIINWVRFDRYSY